MVGSVQDCPFAKNPGCQKKQQAEDCFSRIAQSVLRPYSELDKPLLEKLEQHKHDLQAARRAETAKAVYEIDNDGKIPAKHLPDCQLLVSTETAEACRALEKSLGLKANSLHPTDFANEKNGYRAAVFYDQREEKYVLTFRGTNKNNLIDWKNNINNQLSTATVAEAPSYFAAGALGKLLRGSEPPIEVTGHSKGGGEAFEFLAQSNRSAATVFNSAGPSPRIDSEVKENIAARTRNYQVGGEMLNLMQDQVDPTKTVQNLKWLRGQVDKGLFGFSDMATKITERDNATVAEKEALVKRIVQNSYQTEGVGSLSTGGQNNSQWEAVARLNEIEGDYQKERASFIAELDEKIAEKEKWLKDKMSGLAVPAWAPPFSPSLGDRRVLGGDPDRKSVSAGLTGTSALSDHTMDNMVEALGNQINADRQVLEAAVRRGAPDYENKLFECNRGN